MKTVVLLILVIGTFFSALSPQLKRGTEDVYLSPTHLTYDKDSNTVFLSLSTAAKIAVISLKTNNLKNYLDLPFNPGGTALSKDLTTLIVADQMPEGGIHFIALKTGKIVRSLKVGHTPDALTISPDGKLLFVANRFSNTITVVDYQKKRVLKHINVDRDPRSLAISPDGRLLAVGNNIPNIPATNSFISATISLIDLSALQVAKQVSLANGSQSVGDVVFSNDGKYLYVSHILSRNQLPTTQIERGWINSNALSVIDIESSEYYATLLLDNFNRGAANPSGMAVSEDGKRLHIALSGVHEICLLDLVKMHEKLNACTEDQVTEAANDLRFLSGIKKRIPTSGKSPRHIACSSEKLMVSSYFSEELEVFENAGNFDESSLISLGKGKEMDPIRRGELLFCDADLCFQKWQSCISCHPDSRSDGLNWDLLNDGAGSPKNSKSMLFSHFTPPVMISGIRENAEVAVRAGLKFALFTDYKEEDARDIDSYLRSLKPVPSPYLKNGKLSKKAKKGRLVFQNSGCVDCHSGTYYTDGQKYDVGTGKHPHENAKFDVPALSEIWRTAPYLYDGRAKDMMEVFTIYNTDNQHGRTSHLSDQELEYLIEYVLSL